MGVDIGTSSIKAGIFDSQGNLIQVAREATTIYASQRNYMELDARQIFNLTLKVMERVLSAGRKITAIGFSCQMHSLLLVDKDCAPLDRVVLWGDLRAAKQATYIRKNFDLHSLYQTTGCRVEHPMYPLSKILWYQQHRPELISQTSKYITIKEYLLYQLCGEYFVDYTLAASQGYFDIHQQKWSEDVLTKILSLSPEKFSQPVDATYTLTSLKTEYANHLQLSSKTPIVVGTGDGIAANLGCGACREEYLTSTIGTSGAMRVTTSSPLLDKQRQNWCYSATKKHWVTGGAINNGGIVFDWLQKTFIAPFTNDPISLFDRYLKSGIPKENAPIFWPYLTGERSPDWNEEATASIHGLSYHHTLEDIVRATAEGITFRMFWVYQTLLPLLQQKPNIIACGGYTKSPAWLQIQADIFNAPIGISQISDASLLGAAFLAMIAVGTKQNIIDVLPAMAVEEVVHPVTEHYELYQEIYRKYSEGIL